MLFNSGIFIFLFLPGTLLGLYLLKRFGWDQSAKVWLVFCSAVFYGWFSVKYLVLLGVLIVFNYFMGATLRSAAQGGRRPRGLLAVAVVVNLAVLGYFKYTNFFISNLNALAGTEFVLRQIILPIGISFFTFQKIAYLADAYRGETKPYSFIDFSLFVMFFPQLIAGPIVHHNELIPQIRTKIGIRAVDFAPGLVLFTFGLIKKILIADTLAHRADTLFSVAAAGQVQAAVESWTAALAFTFQIYFDFSAYTDMALGLALMMGIRLPTNFNSPYKAANIVDFWRRWHMTLSRFLRDYVYIPLGGNRKGNVRRYANLMFTMLVGGLWHGAAWTFVVWGGIHGLYLICDHAWQHTMGRLGLAGGYGKPGLWLGRVVTFFAVVLAWVFFRAESFHAAILILKGMFGSYGFSGSSYAWSIDALMAKLLLGGVISGSVIMPIPPVFVALLILIGWVWLLPNSQELLARFKPTFDGKFSPRAAVRSRVENALIKLRLVDPNGGIAVNQLTGVILSGLFLAIFAIQTYRNTDLHQFIYFQF